MGLGLGLGMGLSWCMAPKLRRMWWDDTGSEARAAEPTRTRTFVQWKVCFFRVVLRAGLLSH